MFAAKRKKPPRRNCLRLRSDWCTLRIESSLIRVAPEFLRCDDQPGWGIQREPELLKNFVACVKCDFDKKTAPNWLDVVNCLVATT
jgi:hypothetical protein